ncbi:MAG: tRNA-dihydrouridine synthase, partial [Candidatus Omnitrophota bacterium]
MRIQNTPFGKNPFKRSVAIITAALFLFTGFLNYAPLSFAQSVDIQVQGGNPSKDLSRLVRDVKVRIPPELGLVDEFYNAVPRTLNSEPQKVIFIQDAHDSLEAQENISKIINHLVAHDGVKTVFEEGYEGSVPTDKYFGFIKDPKIKEKVSWFFMDHLRLGGAEYAHINREKDFSLMGADSLKLHKENIEQYRLSAAKKNAIAKDLNALKKELKSLADSRFPKQLKEWLKTKEQFDAKKLDLFTYLGRSMVLLGTNTSNLGSRQNEKLIPLLRFTLEAVKSNDPVVIEKAKHIDAREVFDELIKLEQAIAETYLRDAADKQLFEYYKILSLLSRLNDLQVSQEEYESVKASLKTFDTDSFARFIFSRAPKTLILSRMWERNIRDAVKFYEIAADRDGAVSKTLNQYLAAGNGDRGAKESDVARSLGDGPRTAVLVYGGFHKENIKRILEAKNISYLVVSPRITKPSPRHEEFYRKLMTDGRLSYELPANLQMATRAESRIEVWEGANSSLARAEFQVMEEVARKMPNADPSTFGSAVEQALKVFAHQDPARPGMQEKSFPGLRSGGAGASSGTRKENKSGISGNDMDMAGLFSKSMKFLVKRIKQVRWINILHPALAYGLSEISCKVDSWVVGARFLAQHGLKPYYEFYDWAPDFISAFGAIQFSMAVLLLSKLTILKNLSIKTKTLAKGSHLFVSSLYTTLEIIIPILGIEIPLGLGRTFAWGDIAAYWGAAIVSWCIHDLLFNLEEKFSNKPADILTDPRGKQDESVKIGTYLVLNKPVDVITTEKPEKNAPEVKIAMDLIPANKRNGGHWVGRLDRASSGLLLYGDNNELNRLLLDPTLGQPEKAKKTYEVIVGGNMTKEDMETLKQGVTISVDGTKYFVRADKARVLERYFNGRHPMTKLEIVISEGKFHQVRKMMGALGHNVQALKRTAFGSIKLGDLPSGKIRELTPEEYTWLSDYYRSNRSEMRGKITGTSEIQSMAGGNDKFSSERVITFFSKGRGESLAEFFKDKRVLASVKDEIKKYLLFNLGVSLSLKKQEAETDLIFKKISAKEWVFLFQTPLREIEIKISDQEKGRSIRFSFHVHRDALMRENDAIPDEFFDNVSFRNVEFEFLTLKNSTYIADIFSRWMGRDFDLEHLFYDAPPVKTTLTADKTLVQDGNSLLDVLIPASRVVRPEGYEYSPENPIYVLVENYRTHIGLVDEIIPAIWDKDGLHFVFVGFQGWLRVKSVFSFSGVDKKEWGIPVCSVQSEKFNSSKMDCRGTKQEDLFSGMRDAGALETAPMVRGSGLAERVARYSWGISHAYTDQMVLGALNVPRGQSLLGHYANFEWPGSFGRLKRAHSEKDTALQVVGPYHIADHEQREFFFGSKERTGQSFVRAAHIARALGFSGVNINMCCPLTFFTEVGGGAGLTLNAELATHIVRSITQNVPQLAVSAKMLLLAKEKDRSQVDIPGSVAFAKALEQAGLSKLIVQAQTAEFGPMQPQAVKMIARAIKIPVVYNGNIVAYTETDLARSGFDARKYFSVEGLRNYFQGTVRRFMIGRILLSSPWSLAGRDYTNREIINLALQQAYLMLGVYAGTGEVGLSLFKIGVLYFLRSLKNPGIRENIVTQIENARSNNEIVSILEFFALPEQPND